MSDNNLLILIQVATSYLKEHSQPKSQKYIWSYEVTIQNNSEEILQLVHRYWRMTDISGLVEEMQGPGVIGLQPIIKPGKIFKYSSYCQLLTPQGILEGYYQMQNLDEKSFLIEIPKVILSAPTHLVKPFKERLH